MDFRMSQPRKACHSGSRPPFARRLHADYAEKGMQRLLAILAAGAVAATSVAALQACPTMRGDALERWWCQSTQEGHSRFSCSSGVKANGSTAVMGDRDEDQVRVAGTVNTATSSATTSPPRRCCDRRRRGIRQAQVAPAR